MKIAIPVDENQRTICASFGRTPYFQLYDSETKQSDMKKNPAAEAEGGAGIKAAQFVVDMRADVLITIRCGQNAADVFLAANVKVYKAGGTDAKENLKDYMEGKLEELTGFHAGFHGKS